MLTHSKCNKCGRGWGPGGADPAIFASRAKCQTCQSKVICYAARMPRSVRFWPKQFGSGRRILSCIWAASVVRGEGLFPPILLILRTLLPKCTNTVFENECSQFKNNVLVYFSLCRYSHVVLLDSRIAGIAIWELSQEATATEILGKVY